MNSFDIGINSKNSTELQDNAHLTVQSLLLGTGPSIHPLIFDFKSFLIHYFDLQTRNDTELTLNAYQYLKTGKNILRIVLWMSVPIFYSLAMKFVRIVVGLSLLYGFQHSGYC